MLTFFRALHIVLTAFVASFVYLGLRIRTLFIREAEAREHAVETARGRVARMALAHLGATFVKLGQVMSTRLDLFSPAFIAELRKLQDDLPPFPYAQVERIVEEDFRKPIPVLFASFDAIPIAAASVAQVHRARLHDGTEVAVKVLRPGVRKRALADGRVLRALAKMLEWHPELRLSKPVEHLEEFEDGIVAQTDLRLEIDNYRGFHANFADSEEVHFPEVHEELSSERVLTMEFVRGTKADVLPKGSHAEAASRLTRMFFKMIFTDGMLHADLHPGNFLVMDDGRIAVFDVGLAKKLTKARLDEFIDFTRCMTMGTPEEFIGHARLYHEYLEGSVDWTGFLRDIEAFITKFRGLSKEEMELSVFFDTLFALGRRYKVRPVTEFTLILLGVMTAEGVGKQLDPETDFLGQVADHLMPLLAVRVAEEAALAEAAEAAAAGA